MPDDARSLVIDERPPLVPVSDESFAVAHLPISLQIFFNDNLFKRCQTVANYLAKAEGIAPAHLIGKPEACFAVVSRALTWRLDPYAVASATYQTPNKQVGFYGSLCQAILENSGRLVGGVKFEHYGDWSHLRGKFKIVTGERGGKYPAPDWSGEDEIGLGVTVSAQIKDEDERRTMPFDLVQAFPRNSTLWATDPKTQICYTAVRRFSTSTVPALFMGVPFDREEIEDWAASLKDVTPGIAGGVSDRPSGVPPRPELADFGRDGEKAPARSRSRGKAAAETTVQPDTEAASGSETANNEEAKSDTDGGGVWAFADWDGEVHDNFATAEVAVATYAHVLAGAKTLKDLEAAWENGAALISTLRDDPQHEALADALNQQYGELVAGFANPPTEQQAEAAPQPSAPEAPAAEFDVFVPYPTGVSDQAAAQAWFKLAAAKIKAMTLARCRKHDFDRFNASNAQGLDNLHAHLRSWRVMLDKNIAAAASDASP